MGRDKAALMYHDEPQLMRAMTLLATVCERTFVSARDDQQDSLRQQWPIIADRHQDIGPLAGIAAAQSTYPHVAWLIVACDLPLLDADTLQQLIGRCDAAHQAVAFEIEPGAPEPLCALWLPGSVTAVQQAIQQRQYSPRRLLQQMNTLLLKPDNPDTLRNINSIDDIETLIAT